MRQKIGDAQPRMDGGINTVSDDIALGTNQVRRAENGRLTAFGAITKRHGSKLLSPLAAPGRGMYVWYDDDGTFQVLAVAGTALNTLESTAITAAWTVRAGTLNSTAIPSFAKFLDSLGNEVVFIADSGLLNEWDGTTLATDIPDTPSAKFIKVHNQRLWSCGDPAYPQSIFYSALNDGTTLGNTGSGGGQIVVRTFGDEEVVALASVGSSLLIFHRRGISRLTGFGQDDVNVSPEGITGEIGILSPQSIVEVDGAVYFLTDRGLYVATEGGVAQVGSPERPDPLYGILLTSQYSTGIGAGEQFKMTYAPFGQEILVFAPGYGVYTYHTVLKAWCGPWTGEWATLNAMEPLYTAASTGLFVGTGFVLLAGSDNAVSLADNSAARNDRMTDTADLDTGTIFPVALKLRRMYFGDDSLAKALRWGYVTAFLPGNSGLVVSWVTDVSTGSYVVQSAGGVTWGEFIWNGFTWGPGGSRNYRVPMGGNGYYMDATLTFTGTGNPTISRAAFEAFALGRR